MKRLLTPLAILLLTLITLTGFTQNVGVGINPDGAQPHASAILDVSSTQHGMLIPRMTSTQKGNISGPAEGLMIYQTDDSKGYYYYTGTAWKRIIDESSQSIQVQGQAGETLRHDGTDWVASGNLYNNAGNIGIGTMSPLSKLEIFNSEENTNTFLNIKAASGNNQKIGISLVKHSAHLTPSRWEIFRDQEDSHKLKFRYYSEGLALEPISLLTLSPQSSLSGSIGMGTIDPAASALLEMSSVTKGLLIPRMTKTDRNAINEPATSLLIYQSNETPGFYYNAGTPASPNWMPLSSNNGLAAGSQAGEMLYWDGSAWLAVAPGNEGEVLAFIGGKPTWTCITAPVRPWEGQHITLQNEIKWVWHPTACATGYKWNTTNNYSTATDLGNTLYYDETGLSINTNHTRYVWAYNSYGVSQAREMNSGTFAAASISADAGGDCNCAAGTSYEFFLKGIISLISDYEWRKCINSICTNFTPGTGTNGTIYPGCECCNGTNIIIEVRGTRNYNGVTITSSVLDTYNCAAGLGY